MNREVLFSLLLKPFGRHNGAAQAEPTCIANYPLRLKTAFNIGSVGNTQDALAHYDQTEGTNATEWQHCRAATF